MIFVGKGEEATSSKMRFFITSNDLITTMKYEFRTSYKCIIVYQTVSYKRRARAILHDWFNKRQLPDARSLIESDTWGIKSTAVISPFEWANTHTLFAPARQFLPVIPAIFLLTFLQSGLFKPIAMLEARPLADLSQRGMFQFVCRSSREIR